MTEERQIDYDALLHEAFREAQRGVMRTILTRVAEQGLPGEHHFYVSFHTQAPGVSIAPRLLQKYQAEMTIVLQHRFWDLIVQADRFEVKLTFDSIRERLIIPFSAVRMFFDPSVPFGLQFDEAGADPRGVGDGMGFNPTRSGGRATAKSAAERKKGTRKSKLEQSNESNDSAADTENPVTKPTPKPATAKSAAEKSETEQSATTVTPGPAPRPGPRLVETTANDSAKVVSLDQFRKK
jgi:uncharacterized protein